MNPACSRFSYLLSPTRKIAEHGLSHASSCLLSSHDSKLLPVGQTCVKASSEFIEFSVSSIDGSNNTRISKDECPALCILHFFLQELAGFRDCYFPIHEIRVVYSKSRIDFILASPSL